VIGVTPRSFRGLEYPGFFTAAIPMGAVPLLGGVGLEVAPNQRAFQVVSRLAMAPATARAALGSAFQRCCRSSSTEQLDLIDSRHGVPGSKMDFRAAARIILAMLMSAMSLVLVVVCCNIASLLLVRASARQKEVAVRLALGARAGAS